MRCECETRVRQGQLEASHLSQPGDTLGCSQLTPPPAPPQRSLGVYGTRCPAADKLAGVQALGLGRVTAVLLAAVFGAVAGWRKCLAFADALALYGPLALRGGRFHLCLYVHSYTHPSICTCAHVHTHTDTHMSTHTCKHSLSHKHTSTYAHAVPH